MPDPDPSPDPGPGRPVKRSRAGPGADARAGPRQGARTTHRRGRMTPTRLAALEELGPAWMLDPAALTGDVLDPAVPDPAALDPAALDPVALEPAVVVDALDGTFGRRAPRLLDIGVGNGEATRQWAAAHPDHDVLAVELHRPGIAHLLRRLDEEGPANVRVVDADVTALLDAIPPGTLTGVRILFPDPWPKRRHHKRRLVDPRFVAAATERLAAGGRLHLATDWLDYADAMRIAIAADERLVPVVDHHDGPALDTDGTPIDAPTRWRTHRPERPTTAYERRGLDAGRTITDLVAVRT